MSVQRCTSITALAILALGILAAGCADIAAPDIHPRRWNDGKVIVPDTILPPPDRGLYRTKES